MISKISSHRLSTTTVTLGVLSLLFAFNAGNALGGDLGGALGGVGNAVGGAINGVGGALGSALGGGGGDTPNGAGGSAPAGSVAPGSASATAASTQSEPSTAIGKRRLKRIVIIEDGERCDNTLLDFLRDRDCNHRRTSSDEAYGDALDQAPTSPVDEPVIRKPKIKKKAGQVQPPVKKKATAPKKTARLNIEKPSVEKPKLSVDPKLIKPKTVEKAEPPVKKKATAPKPTARLNVEKPSVEKPKLTVDPKLIKPKAVEKAEPESEPTLSCDKAGAIVGDFGFVAIKPSDCDGRVYAFNASRDGKAFTITLNAVNGELIEVRKAP